MRPGGEQLPGDESGFSKVAGDYFFRIADSGEIDAGIPSEQYIDIRRYMIKFT
jgi:hypothetical protein